ncbi:MAG: class GN sortase [bacterium]
MILKITPSRGLFLLGITILIGATIPALYIPLKAQLAQQLIKTAWADTLKSQQYHRPWSWADTWPVMKLEATELGQSNFVLEGDMGRILAFGAGHNTRSSTSPENGNIIISGHRDGSFSWLDELEQGQHLKLEFIDQTVFYQVTHKKIVNASSTRLQTDTDQAMLTLVTCYPLSGITSRATQRLVITAIPITKSISITQQVKKP